MHTMTKRQGKSGTIDVKALLAEDEEFLRALVRTALQEVLETCPRHCRINVAPVFGTMPGSKERAPFLNSAAKTRTRRCRARLGLPWARRCSSSASPRMIRSRLRPRGGPV